MQAQKRCYGLAGLEPFVEDMERAMDEDGRPVFVSFGDDAEGCAVRDASILQHLAGLPPAMPEVVAQVENERTAIPLAIAGEDNIA